MKQVRPACSPGYVSMKVLIRHDLIAGGRAGAIWALDLPVVLELNLAIPVRMGHLGSTKLLHLINMSMNEVT
jgi:hypothetical protein